jgi:proteasome lid subunit RPN8/RPN11
LQPRPPQSAGPAGETLVIDLPSPAAPTPPADPPPDKETQLAANEWGAADLDVTTDRAANLTEAIELLPDAPRPASVSLTATHSRSPVLHAYRRRALELAQRHAREYPRREVGGILLGIIRDNGKGQYFSVVTGIIRADTAIGREASVQFSPDTWVDTLAIRDRHPVYGDEDTWQVVGWYHTHPGFGIFLSSLDVHTHGAFLHPGHLALVIDPSNGTYGTFGWNRDQTQPVRLSEEPPTAQWKTLLDDEQTQKWLGDLGLTLSELPPAELTAEPPAGRPPRAEVAGATIRSGAPDKRPPRRGKGDKKMA